MEQKNQPKNNKGPNEITEDDLKVVQKVNNAQLELLKATLRSVLDSPVEDVVLNYASDPRLELFLRIKNAQSFEEIGYELHVANGNSEPVDRVETAEAEDKEADDEDKEEEE